MLCIVFVPGTAFGYTCMNNCAMITPAPIPRIFTALMLTAILSSCAMAVDPVQSEITVKPFTEVLVEGPFRIRLVQDDACRLRIEGQERSVEALEIDSREGKLSVRFREKSFRVKDYKIDLVIYFRNLEELEIRGPVELRCERPIRAGNIKFVFEGAGDVVLDLEAAKIISEINGVGSFRLKGQTDYHKVSFSGVGSYDASMLTSKYTLVESNGVGSVKVHAADKFIGRANGVGSVDYYGEPESTEISASGLGKINRR